MEVNKSNKISFDELAHSSSEFVMDIFSNNKFKFTWFFDVITKMEYYKNLKITHNCFVCGTTKHLNYCSCKDIAYCSIKCQKLDWETHKLTCKFYFKENCKKEFNYIIGQPMDILILSKKEYSKLDQDKKKILKQLNYLINDYISDKSKEINLLDDKCAFDLMVKRRVFLYSFTSNSFKSNAFKSNAFKSNDTTIHIYNNSEKVIKELYKIYILNNN